MTAARSDRILLIGMMGAGKTSVGRRLASRLGRPFLDNDTLVRDATGREPAEIDATDGEDALHDAEIRAFRAALGRPGPAVIAVAGAIVDAPAERGRLATAGTVVWLRARPETLRARIGSGAGRRHDATDLAWLTARAGARGPGYLAVADLIVDVDQGSADDAVDRILAELPPRPPRPLRPRGA
jgi:shikimate kinase